MIINNSLTKITEDKDATYFLTTEDEIVLRYKSHMTHANKFRKVGRIFSNRKVKEFYLDNAPKALHIKFNAFALPVAVFDYLRSNNLVERYCVEFGAFQYVSSVENFLQRSFIATFSNKEVPKRYLKLDCFEDSNDYRNPIKKQKTVNIPSIF